MSTVVRLSVPASGTAYSETTPANVPFTPKWTFSGGAVATVSLLRIALDAQWVDERLVGNFRFPGAPAKVDATFLLNGKVTASLDSLVPGLEVFLTGENLTDSDYAYRPGYPMPGAAVSGGASLRF